MKKYKIAQVTQSLQTKIGIYEINVLLLSHICKNHLVNKAIFVFWFKKF